MKIKNRIWAILVIAGLLVPAFVAGTVAQEGPTTPAGCENPSPSITISSSRTEVPADGVSTAEIQVVVSWPEESNITGPAGTTLVDLSITEPGWLTAAENESTTGRRISLITDTNGIVTAVLSGDETGIAFITAVTFWGCNKTTVTFVAPGATATAPPSGDGGGGGGNGGAPVTTPTASPSATLAPGATETPTASPSATLAPGATETPTASPSATLTPGATGTPTASPTSSPTASPAATPTPLPTGGIPGFQAGFAIAGLLAVAYVALRTGRNA